MKLTNIFKHNFFRTELTIKVNVKKERLFDSSTGIFKFRIRKKLKSSMCSYTAVNGLTRYLQILTHQLISTSYPELENDRRTVKMSFFLNVNFCKKKMFLGFAHMKKKRLCVFQEKKGDFFARLNSARLCSDCLKQRPS